MRQNTKQPHHIVIVGGGAGGLELVTKLGRYYRRIPGVDVTLVDQTLTHLWKPLLHEVAAGVLDSNEDELNLIAHAAQNGYQFQYGRMKNLHRDQKTILLSAVLNDNDKEIVPERAIKYDTLVLSVGSVSNDFGVPGVGSHCYFLDNRHQADRFHEDFLKACLHYQAQSTPPVKGQLNVVVIGGGATGVELAAELHHMIAQAASYGLDKAHSEKTFKVTLVESSDRILAHLPDDLSKAVNTQLTLFGVEILTGERVSAITEDHVETLSGHRIPSKMKLWAAGIKAPAFLKELDGLETNSVNQLLVNESLQTSKDNSIFAFGDCAACAIPGSDKNVPPRAQAAHQQAHLLFKSIKHQLKGKPLRPYIYRDYGSLISLSRQGGVGYLMGCVAGNFLVEGKLARLIYVSLYKSHLNVLHGYWRVFLMSLAHFLTRRIKPKLKLH